jgi:transposase-like protein
MNLSEISSLSENQAREYFEKVRWPHGRFCPHCGSVESTKLQGKVHRVGLYDCHGCHAQFTATIGTIMEDSHLPVRTWLMAFSILCSAKKGISALQLQRQLGLGSYKSAWHLAHRIRHAMAREPLKGLLGAGGGTVETDETWVGGKPRKRAGQPAIGGSRGGRSPTKTRVVGLVERGGRARAHVVPDLTAPTLKAAVRAHVDPSARLMTDENHAYIGLGDEFAGGHETVTAQASTRVATPRPTRLKGSLGCLSAV